MPWNFVASTTLSRRPPASALPTISSDSPREYTSAVSMKLMPGVERAVDDADARVVVGITPRPEHHRPQAERADVDTGAAERALVHLTDVTPGGPPAPGLRMKIEKLPIAVISRRPSSDSTVARSVAAVRLRRSRTARQIRSPSSALWR